MVHKIEILPIIGVKQRNPKLFIFDLFPFD